MRRHLSVALMAIALLNLFGCSSSSVAEPPASGMADLASMGTDLAKDLDLSSPPDLSPAMLGKAVLVFSGEGGLPGGSGRYLIPSFDELRTTVQPLGFTIVETSAWPADLTAYRTIIWSLPGASLAAGFTIPETRVQDLLSYLMKGGRLVLVGDIKFVYDQYNSGNSILVMNDLATRLGVSMRFAQSLPGELGCGTGTHRLGRNVSSISYNTSCGIHIASPAQWLSCPGAAAQDRLCGEVVLVNDVQTLSTSASANAQLVNSLVTTPGPSPCAP